MRSFRFGYVVILVLAVVLYATLFRVDERKTVLVFRLGELSRTINEPGLYFKMPFVDNKVEYDDRILPLDSDEFLVTPQDNRKLIVDAFVRWKIVDAPIFHRAVSPEGLQGGSERIESILETALKGVLGDVPSEAVLSADRVRLMEQIRANMVADASSLGVEIVDVRIKRTDLPQANLAATFERMKAERFQEAADERARGQEAARRVTALAERQAVEIESQAQKEAQVIRGEADGERNRIFADAYGKNAEFFDFYRSLEGYRKAISNNNSAIVMSPDSSFFKYLEDETGGVNNAAPAGN